MKAIDLAIGGKSSFSLVRPPGHHAGPAYGMGFCSFNNAAIEAAYALQKMQRVAIVDWDVHHGNEIQGNYNESDRVLYCSIHRYPFYSGIGSIKESGTGKGEGYSVNIPFPAGSGMQLYSRAFNAIIIPALKSFKPELIIVSSGHDALSDDPLWGMKLHPEDFGNSLRCSPTSHPFLLYVILKEDMEGQMDWLPEKSLDKRRRIRITNRRCVFG